jgi:beta-glucosidase
MSGHEGALRERLAALSLEAKVRLLTGADVWALHPEPTIGLDRIVSSDGPAGVRGERWDERDPSTNVPSPTALAATWDAERVERIGRLLAAEAVRKGVHVILAPTVNLHRSPYGGRHFECFSEDPLLTARIGTAYVRGVQSGGVAATVKHFVGNDSETERWRYDARIDERALREVYLAPFEAIVDDGGAWAVMAAYNQVNGVTMTASPLLRDVLKDEWGFDGVVMSDWHATRLTDETGNAALDLAMPGPDSPWGDALVAAVRAGRVSAEAVDDKVLRLLLLAARVGALDGIEPAAPKAKPWSDQAMAAEVRGAAAAGFVLARHADDLLPLDPAALRTVAVVGPNAAVARSLGGGSATVLPPYTVSPLDGLRAALGRGVTVDTAPGVRPHNRTPVAPAGLLRGPDGDDTGLEIRFLAADGTVLGHEHRRGAVLNWHGAHGNGIRAADVAAVEVHGRLHAATTGEYLLGCSGVGRFVLTVDGEIRVDRTLALKPDDDPVVAIMTPPQAVVGVPLDAGAEASFVVRHEPDRAGTEHAVEGTMFQVNAEPPWAGDDAELERAVALAAGADVAVVVVGTTEEVESEGFDRRSLSLPGRQDELVRRVHAANPRTVVVVNAGAPVLLPWLDQVPAVLLTWFPGQEFGNALADVLLGEVEPGGRLPVAWPATELDDGVPPIPSTTPVDGVLDYTESIHIGQRGYDRAGVAPALPFGFGLGYTTWDFLDASSVDGGVRVTVRNTGSRRGREVVQVYASRPDSVVERPVRWLAGFAAVTADPGETATVDVALSPRAFQHWSDGGWVTEPGSFTLEIGRSSMDLPLTVS